MMLSHPNQVQGLQDAGSGGDESTLMQRAQIEASVKSVRKCAQVSSCVFAEVECMMTPAQARLEVAENGIDPLKWGNSLGLRPATTIRSCVHPAAVTAAEAGQAVGVNAGAGSQAGRCPVLDGFKAEARYGGSA